MHRTPFPPRVSAQCATLAAVLLAVLAAPARAKDDLLEVLAQKGAITLEEYEKLKAQQRATEPSVNTDDEFKITSGDGSMSVQIGTLQQFDVASYDDSGDDNTVDLADGSELRRSRISVQGNLSENWQYKAEYDFATGTAAFTDINVIYGGWKPLLLTMGNFKQPFSMEAATTDKNGTFMERGLPFAFVIARAPGVMLGSSGANWSVSGGAFGEPLSSAQASDEGRGIAARATYAPVFTMDRVLHIGISFTSREPTKNNSTNSTGDKFDTMRFRSKPESDVLAQRLVDTGEIPNVDRFDVVALEMAGELKSFSAQGEYHSARVTRDGGDDLNFSGWYFQLTYTLTGEARPYRGDRGYFDGIKGRTSVGSGGWGAWELALRMSELDLTDGDIEGGRERNVTFGLNWYMTRWLRLTANIVKVLDIDAGPFDGVEPLIYQMRFQIAI